MVEIDSRMVGARPWKDLTATAFRVYMQLLEARSGSADGLMAMSAGDAARQAGCTSASAHNALKQLQHKGFIVQREPGRPWHPAVFELSEGWMTWTEGNDYPAATTTGRNPYGAQGKPKETEDGV